MAWRLKGSIHSIFRRQTDDVFLVGCPIDGIYDHFTISIIAIIGIRGKIESPNTTSRELLFAPSAVTAIVIGPEYPHPDQN